MTGIAGTGIIAFKHIPLPYYNYYIKIQPNHHKISKHNVGRTLQCKHQVIIKIVL